MTQNHVVEMNVNPDLITCFFFLGQNSSDILDKTPPREHRQMLENTLSSVAWRKNVFLTIIGCEQQQNDREMCGWLQGHAFMKCTSPDTEK